MSTRVWIIRSIVVVQLVSALRILPQRKHSNINSGEQAAIKIVDTMANTEPTVSGNRRFNYIEKMILRDTNQDVKSLQQSAKPTVLRRSGVRNWLPKKNLLEVVEEQELNKVVRNGGSALSELLEKPYVETRGKNDFLVIQSKSVDPFVTVIPNSIYYNAEKKCVNWLDACSLKGIRSHLLQRVQDV